MALSKDARQIVKLLDNQGVLLRIVETHDRGELAQVYQGTDGLLIAPVSVVDELIEADKIELDATRSQRFLHVGGNRIFVGENEDLFDSMGQKFKPEIKIEKVYKKKIIVTGES